MPRLRTAFLSFLISAAPASASGPAAFPDALPTRGTAGPTAPEAGGPAPPAPGSAAPAPQVPGPPGPAQVPRAPRAAGAAPPAPQVPRAPRAAGEPLLVAAWVGASYFLGASVPLLPVVLGARSLWAPLAASSVLVIVVSFVLSFLSGMDARRRVLANLGVLGGAVALTYAAAAAAKALWGIGA